jgi:hypothetical protein
MAVRPPRSGSSLTVASTTAPSTQTDDRSPPRRISEPADVAVYLRIFAAANTWTDTEQTAKDVAYDRERALTTAAVRLLRRAGKLRATTPAGVYAKALLVRSSLTGASTLARSLADDLIACDDLRQTLPWPGACRNHAEPLAGPIKDDPMP